MTHYIVATDTDGCSLYLDDHADGSALLMIQCGSESTGVELRPDQVDRLAVILRRGPRPQVPGQVRMTGTTGVAVGRPESTRATAVATQRFPSVARVLRTLREKLL